MPRVQRTEADDRLLRGFGYRLHNLRTARMTQMDLAHRAGLHATYIGQVENGLRNVALLNVYSLLAALDAQLTDLLPPVQQGRG